MGPRFLLVSLEANNNKQVINHGDIDMYNKYQVFTLDVWGNEIDGYEINDWFAYCKIDGDQLDDFDSFCRKHLMGFPDDYELDDRCSDDFFEIKHKKSGKPILQFQKIDD